MRKVVLMRTSSPLARVALLAGAGLASLALAACGAGRAGAARASPTRAAADGGRNPRPAAPAGAGNPVPAPLGVGGGRASGMLPAATATITASEYAFKTSGLKSGRQQIELDNVGT